MPLKQVQQLVNIPESKITNKYLNESKVFGAKIAYVFNDDILVTIATLPHAIELLQLEYDKLFTVLNSEKEIRTLINPFISADLADVIETVESQLASVKIPLGRLSSPELYYLLSDNDFTLNINNPQAPKIVCLGNDPVKSEALAPIISLFVDRLNKIINQQGKYKFATIYDEFATLRATSVQKVIATGGILGIELGPTINIRRLIQIAKWCHPKIHNVLLPHKPKIHFVHQLFETSYAQVPYESNILIESDTILTARKRVRFLRDTLERCLVINPEEDPGEANQHIQEYFEKW